MLSISVSFGTTRLTSVAFFLQIDAERYRPLIYRKWDQPEELGLT